MPAMVVQARLHSSNIRHHLWLSICKNRNKSWQECSVYALCALQRTLRPVKSTAHSTAKQRENCILKHTNSCLSKAQRLSFLVEKIGGPYLPFVAVREITHTQTVNYGIQTASVFSNRWWLRPNVG